MGASPSIAFVCATTDRPCLRLLQKSFVHGADSGDRLFVLGDGCTPTRHVDDPRVEIEAHAKVGNHGHELLYRRLNAGVPTDFIALIGDDDMIVPGALERVAWLLRDVMVLHPVTSEIGIEPWWLAPPGVRSRRFGGLRALVPNKKPFSDFGKDFVSDGVFLYREAARHRVVFTDEPVQACWVPLYPCAWYERLGLDAVEPWSAEFASYRSPRESTK